jgi:autotransporter-associated beta strand protein
MINASQGNRFRGLRTSALVLILLLSAGWNSACFAGINIDVTAYGAIPGDGLDDSAAFRSALDAMLAATPRGGHLYVPDGNYHFSSQVSIQITNNVEQMTIQGQSKTGVRLICNNTNGVLLIGHDTGNGVVNVIRDLTFVANRAGAGTAMEVRTPVGGQSHAKRAVTVLDIDVTYTASTEYYFNTGIALHGIQRPLIRDCSFAAPTTDADMSDSSPNFLPAFGIDFGGCYNPIVQNCSVSGAYTAYSMVCSGTDDQEDGGLFNCTADYCRVGTEYDIPNNPRAGFQFRGQNIRARDQGLILNNRRIFNISDNTFRQLSAAYPLTDIQLGFAKIGVIVRNIFSGDLSGGRKNVTVGPNGESLLIRNNTLSGTGISALVVDPAAINILVQDATSSTNIWTVDASGSWTNTTNWTDATAPGVSGGDRSMDVAVFSTALTTNCVVTVDADRNIGGIIFANPAHLAATNASTSVGYTLSGGRLVLSDGGVIQVTDQSGTNTSTIASAISIQDSDSSATFRNSATGNKAGLTITGTISGNSAAGHTTTVYIDGVSTSTGTTPSSRNNNISGVVSDGTMGGKLALVKNGTGLWAVTGNNTFTGGMTVNAGTLRYFGAGNTVFGRGLLTIGDGVIFNKGNNSLAVLDNPVLVNGNFTFSGSINSNSWRGDWDLGAGSRIITVSASNTISGMISNGSLTKAGEETLVLSGMNTYAGGTTVSSGTLLANSDGALGAGNITVANGAILILQTNTVINNQSALVLGTNATLIIDCAGSETVGCLSLNGGLTWLTNGLYNASALRALGAGTYTASGSLSVSGVASDPASTPYGWLIQYGLTNFNTDAMADADGDGLLTWQEYIAGTNPTNSTSSFRITGRSVNSQGSVIRWSSVSNRFYSLSRATNLLQAFSAVAGAINLPATPPENVFTNSQNDGDAAFYKINVHE